MKSRKVDNILLPCPADLPATPSVPAGEKITRAIELTICHNLNRIAIVRNQRVMSRIRLEDGVQEIGLEMPGKS